MYIMFKQFCLHNVYAFINLLLYIQVRVAKMGSKFMLLCLHCYMSTVSCINLWMNAALSQDINKITPLEIKIDIHVR